MMIHIIKSELGGGWGWSLPVPGSEETTMLSPITESTPIWATLLDVTQGWATVSEMLKVAKTHRNGAKMVSEAVAWGLIEPEEEAAWSLAMESMAEAQAGC